MSRQTAVFGVLARCSGEAAVSTWQGLACSTQTGALHLVAIPSCPSYPQIHSVAIALGVATPSAPLHVPSTTTARGRDNCKSLELVRWCGCRSWLLFRPLRNCLRPRKKNSTKATHETTNNNHSLKTSNNDYSSLDHPLSYNLGPLAIGLNSHPNYTSGSVPKLHYLHNSTSNLTL